MQGSSPPHRDDHKRVLVPLEAWEYNSPLLKIEGKRTDLGLLAEALLYYDQVFVDIQSEHQLEDLLRWAIERDHINSLLTLIHEGVLKFHYHAFLTTAVSTEGVFRLLHIEDTAQARGASFPEKIIYRADYSCLHARKQRALIQEIERNYVEAKVDNYELPIEDARRALGDPEYCSQLLQTFIDDLYRGLHLGKPPQVSCEIEQVSPETYTIKWNTDFTQITNMTSGKLDFRPDIPIIGEAHTNRCIMTAIRNGLDLSLGDVMATLAGNKLVEASEHSGRVREIIQELKIEVEFPDVRGLVNSGDMYLDTVLEIRAKSSKFRGWLQQEGDKDRNALSAYHNEVAQASGVAKQGVATLKLFGILSSTGAAAARVVDPTGAVSTALTATTGVTNFLGFIGDRLVKDWKPVVFGDWVKKRLDS
ncbi:MAG: hypothetical protein DLM70_03285 [Chloroflexi bacterium]|nr:MAG: hypothetical protein DLM70_03285 [Chloroflexota bacterium]